MHGQTDRQNGHSIYSAYFVPHTDDRVGSLHCYLLSCFKFYVITAVLL